MMDMNTDRAESSNRQTGLYLKRAMVWRCPVCGVSPMFLPVKRVESISDWVDTLDGCPRCDYYYERESGYFLFPLWIVNFSIVAFLGVAQVLILYYVLEFSIPAIIFATLVTMWAIGLLLVRHTKSIFLAFDHLVHPHTDDLDYPPPASGSLGVEAFHLGKPTNGRE